MFKKALSTVALVSAAVFSGQAMADTAQSNFKVKITILKSCSVAAGSASDINLGSVLSTATDTSGSNTISVTCSKNTPYFIGLAPSNSNTTGAGVMAPEVVGSSPDTVPYQLHSVSATGPVWGNTATAAAIGNGVAGTGTGLAVSHTVYAVAPSANYTPTSYVDTVTVTVNY
ncbi:Csu type fimbrial protein [Ottowia thiooxydans]|uniref:Csu type fimbrial protein n=1 Tax=Ottowia thiooxydans TaxID=219182 RepID=UPI0003F64F26|nr:spore coat protein U domain-containing protein [Ottowia thiooxydans]